MSGSQIENPSIKQGLIGGIFNEIYLRTEAVKLAIALHGAQSPTAEAIIITDGKIQKYIAGDGTEKPATMVERAPEPKISIGRIVQYRLGSQDVEKIDRRRAYARARKEIIREQRPG